ncbi:MAG: RNA 2',3'-cyclic phosphodiesterase [Candidatus Aenigmarchaeota archaeon]|nr:RNA 2',3'-cyclic phosphodiesterase [Candidatus Aenigmarchaeota archaeon]
MRTFIAIDIPEELKPEIISIQYEIEGSDIKFVEPENLHFNIKFLGDTTEDQIPKLTAILDEISNKFEAFDIEINGMGAFPSNTHIKVLWLGVKDGSNELLGLAEAIDSKTKEMGFREEERTFKAHLTLGRIKSKNGNKSLSEMIENNKDVSVGKFKANSIKLIKSELTPQGPQYTVVHEAKFG